MGSNSTPGGQVSVPPFDDVFTAEQWGHLNSQQISDASNFFDSDTNVITGFNFRMDALLNGGIIFKRHNKEIDKKAKDWLSQAFSKFFRDVVRSRWCYGIAACAWIQHEIYGGTPVVLDLTQLTVAYKKSLFGETQYRYFYQPLDGSLTRKEVMEVTTFTYDAPDVNGNLRSLVLMLVPDHTHELMLMHYALQATKGRANPPMITETELAVHDDKAVTVPMARTPRDLLLASRRQQGAEPNETATSNMKDVLTGVQNYSTRVTPLLEDAMINNVAYVQQVPHFSGVLPLAAGKRFVAAPLPEVPVDLLTFRVARQERAFSLMGVPLAMVSNNTSTGGAKIGSGENPNTFVIFDNSQQALKLELINLGKRMFTSFHLDSYLQEYLEETPVKEWSVQGAAKSCDVIVEMPSIPDEDRLLSYYMQGFLKYESVVRYLGSKHGIPEDNWNPSPAMTVKEANGIEPKEPAAKKPKK